MFERFVSLLIRSRWLVVVTLLVLTGLAAWQATAIRFDFSPRSLFLTADEEVQFLPPAGLKMATIICAMVPIMVLYPFLQKHFAKGILIGAVKE